MDSPIEVPPRLELTVDADGKLNARIDGKNMTHLIKSVHVVVGPAPDWAPLSAVTVDVHLDIGVNG